MAKDRVVRTIRKNQIADELKYLKQRGVVLPRHPQAAARTASEMRNMVEDKGSLEKTIQATAFQGRANDAAQLTHNQQMLAAARASRGNKRYGSASDAVLAIPRFYDPMEYFDLSGLPFNMADEGHRHKLHKWMRLYYATHHLVGALVDIYTRFPLAGMSFYSKDKAITDFYETLFLDRMKYEDFLVSLGREYWLIGEAFPLATFNEVLGVWDGPEELLNPEDIVIERIPFLKAQYLKLKPPEHLKRLVRTRTPPKEYRLLVESMPELIPYLDRGEPFPISEVLLKHVAFRLSDWDDHGTPLMLRALRTLMHEEKLLASQDAIAERLYSPLILAKLGIQDLGNGQGPWIPGDDALEALRDDFDLALSSDMRLIVHHFALEVENVFGREQMPDLGGDFDRVDARLMQVFGIDPSLLTGGKGSEPYASSAIRAELMNQMLSTYQKFLKEHARDRMLIVAEAQEHWDYDKRGETRVPIMEEVVEYDEEGNMHIVMKHKLLVPDLDMATLDMRDEATERQFLMALRQFGVPISDQNLMVGVSFEWEDSLDDLAAETIKKTVAQQLTKLQIYKICLVSGLPIPPDVRMEVESIAPPGGGGGAGAMGGGASGGMGGGMPGGGPGGGQFVMPAAPEGLPGAGRMGPMLPGGPPAAQAIPGGPRGAVPEISSERRPGMPTMSSVEADLSNPPDTLLTIDQVNERIANAQKVLADLEAQERLKRMQKVAKRSVASDEEPEEKVKWDYTNPKVIRLPEAKREMGIEFIPHEAHVQTDEE